MAEIIFYRHKHGKLLDHTIGWLTWGQYSHVEFKLTDGPNARGPCISSSWRDGGVRWKHIDLDSGKWTRYHINPKVLPMEKELAIGEWALTQKGRKYDTLGVLMVPFTWWKKKLFRLARWFCSELVSYICIRWKVFSFPTCQLSPSRLERLCRAHPEVFERVP